MPAAPAAGQPREPAADEVAGEMLQGHAGRPALPALAELSEVGQHDIAQDGRHGQIGQEPVQHGLRGRHIESVQCLPEPGGGLTPCGLGEARPGEIAKGGNRIAAERGACRLGRGQPIGEISLHPADPPLVRLGVQPEAAWRAHRLQQAVAILPGPEHMVAHAEAPAQLTDAQQRAIPGKLHDNTVPSLDSSLTIPSGRA